MVEPATGLVFYDLVDSLPTTINGDMSGTRTRCKDRQSLESLIYWYAFQNIDKQNIDKNYWVEGNEHDPRIFQGFVWKGFSE